MYDTDLVASSPLSIAVKELLRSVNIFQSYEQIMSGTFFYGSRCRTVRRVFRQSVSANQKSNGSGSAARIAI